ncbi:hypothetical protein BJY00DRAFT_21351 [Aspergillus carlsbadensis]|nr:hypothetical protein BJY00DRAFT_21351 [Aspergillus carlsbadensis]
MSDAEARSPRGTKFDASCPRKNMIGFWSLSRLRPVRKESSSQRRRQTWPQERASDRWGPKAVSIQRAEGNARGAHARVSWGSNQPGRKSVRDEAEVEEHESPGLKRGSQFPPESGQPGPYRTVPVLSHFLPGPPPSLAVRSNTSTHTLPVLAGLFMRGKIFNNSQLSFSTGRRLLSTLQRNQLLHDLHLRSILVSVSWGQSIQHPERSEPTATMKARSEGPEVSSANPPC